MKTELIKYNSELNTFPLIAKHKDNGYIVLFIDEIEGFVLHTENPSGGYAVGYYSTCWCSVFEKETWEILNEITIKFKQ